MQILAAIFSINKVETETPVLCGSIVIGHNDATLLAVAYCAVGCVVGGAGAGGVDHRGKCENGKELHVCGTCEFDVKDYQ